MSNFTIQELEDLLNVIYNKPSVEHQDVIYIESLTGYKLEELKQLINIFIPKYNDLIDDLIYFWDNY